MRKMPVFLWFFFVFPILLFPSIALCESFIVHQPTTEGFDEGTAKVVGELLAGELDKRDGTDAAYVTGEKACVDKECAEKQVADNLADAVVVGRLLKLGDKAIFATTVVRKSGTAQHRVTGEGIGEMERLMPRLADAIATGKSFEETMTVTSVSEKEREEHKRIQGDFSWGPGIGLLVPVAQSYGDTTSVMFGFLLPFRYEIARWGFEFETGVYFDDQSSEYTGAVEYPLDFSFMHFFSDGIGSPFVGGTLGIHYLAVSDKLTDEEELENRQDIWSARAKNTAANGVVRSTDREEDEKWNQWGASLGAFGGYEFLRTHTFHVDARAGYRFTFIELDGNWAHGPFVAVHFTFGHNK